MTHSRTFTEAYVLAHWDDRTLSIPQMAKELGCSIATIQHIKQRNSLPYRTRKLSQEIVGQKFGRLTVTRRDDTDKRYVYCECDCTPGKEFRILYASVKYGDTTSCGCVRREIASNTMKKYHEKIQNSQNSIG